MVAPPFDDGSIQSTVTSVEEFAVTRAFRGAVAVVTETDSTDPPDAEGVTDGLSLLAVPAPALLTARIRMVYSVPFVSEVMLSGEVVDEMLVQVVPALVEYS